MPSEATETRLQGQGLQPADLRTLADTGQRASLRPIGDNAGALIERAIVLLLFALLVLGVAIVLRPLATAIAFGTILTVATWPLRMGLVRAGLRRGLVATVLLVASLALLAAPVVLVAPKLSTTLADMGQRLEQRLQNLPDTPPDWVTGIPVVGSRIDQAWQKAAQAEDLRTVLAPYADRLRACLMDAAGALADSVVQFLLALIVCAMLWASGEAVAQILRDLMRRLGGVTAVAALHAAAGSLRSVAYGVVGTAVMQGVLMTLGAVIAGAPAPVLLGFIVMLLAISQIGAPLIILVWGGAAWSLFHAGDTLWGVFMAVWGLILVSMSDNVVKPWLISQGVEMPLALVILGVFGGFVALGFLGLFIGPALLAVAFTLLRAWRTQALSEDA
ncbi:MAG TPA: AI-2E family transporter [Acetobacteraceae bacterium]|nr:AI-2E family transporter [Acetobacteraceae bacterium]